MPEHALLLQPALKHIHLQSQEVLLRHLMHHVDARVQAYKAEQAGGAK